MRYVWALISWIFIMLVVSPVSADGVFDTSECKSNCVFRYNIRFEWGGAPMLPDDSQRREGYLKCLDKCDNEFWGNMSGPSTD